MTEEERILINGKEQTFISILETQSNPEMGNLSSPKYKYLTAVTTK